MTHEYANCHVDFLVTDECENLYDSYGEICVQCNCCGRFDKSTMSECRIKTYKRQLKEEVECIDDPRFPNQNQKKNILLNIIYVVKKIAKEQGIELEEK